ncbi:MAG TPA: response regulator transcription factor [Buttiauxella sp.]|jgi:two-component system capsular synthesis response regulator RcsB
MHANIIIAYDLKLIRCGIKAVVNNMPADRMQSASEHHSFNIMADVSSPIDLIHAMRHSPADLLLLGHSLDTSVSSHDPVATMDSFTLIKWLIKKYPKIKIIIITPYTNASMVRMAIESGISGYVSMDSCELGLERAINAVLNNELYIEKKLMYLALQQTEKNSMELSVKEFEVIRLLCKGFNMAKIASYMHISIKTVSAHKLKAMSKLQVKTDCQLYSLLSKTNHFEMTL